MIQQVPGRSRGLRTCELFQSLCQHFSWARRVSSRNQRARPEVLSSNLKVIVSVAQACPTLGDPMDCSPMLLCPWGFSRQEYWSGLPCPPPGDLPNLGIEPASPVLQTDSFLSLLAYMLSHFRLFATPCTVAHQTPLSMGILQARKPS